MSNNSQHKPGYKHTPLGWIPEEWEVFEVGQISKVSSGGTPDRKNENYWNGSIPWVSTSLIDFNVIDQANEFITEEGLKNSSAKLFEPGTILMAMYGQGKTRGKVAKLGIAATTNQACAAIVNDGKVHTDFLFQFFVHNYSNIRKLSNTGSQENLNGELIKSINLKLPTLPEQLKIATILSTWDEAITKSQHLIAQLQQRNKGLMRQLLSGKKRLKDFEEEWKEMHLGDVLTERNETGFINLNLLSVGSLGIYPQSQSEKRDISNIDKSKYKRICPGDIGYNTMRMWQGRSALSSLEGIVSPAYTVVTPKDQQYSLFYAFLFKLPSVVNKFFRNSQGLVEDTLNCKFKDLAIVKVEVPEYDEQVAIADIISKTVEQIKLYEEKLAALQQQKKGLMQKLLTGEVRVRIDRI